MQFKLSRHLTKGLVISAVAIPGLLTAGLSTHKLTKEDIAARREAKKLDPQKSLAKQNAPKANVKAGDKQLYGFHCYTEYGALEGWSGAVKILAGPTCPELVHQIEDGVVFQATYMNGKAFVVLHDSFIGGDNVTYQVYDASSWNLEANVSYTPNSPNILPYGLAYDHTSGKLYGSFYADTESFVASEDAQFGTVDFSNAGDPVQIIGEFPERMRAMTFDANGNLFGISYSGDLYSINKFTGDATLTGVHVDLPTQDFGDPSDGFMSYGRDSMCCDWETGDFYITYSDDIWNTYVSRFNPSTGEAEIVADYSYSDYGSEDCNVLTGLYFEQKIGASDKVIPMAPSNMTATAVGTELKAEVSFTMPSADTNGNAIESAMSWSVSDGRNTLATGTGDPASTITVTVATETGGRTTFVATVELDGEVSVAADASAFIGCDTPVIYGLPTVRGAGLDLTVSWNAADAANGGNLDPVTYTVVRMPDNITVAETLADTKYTDHLTSDIKTLYSYVITPVSGAVQGESVTSRSLYAGTYLPLPYEDDFSDEQRFLQYPFIDANNDGNIWEYSSKYNGVAMYAANENDADDYLLIGPFKMVAGSTYTFHMTADGHNFTETIAVYAGSDANDVKSFSHEVIAPAQLNPMTGEKALSGDFVAPEAGDYYFGIKACTEGASQFIYVYDIAVKGTDANMAAEPTDFELIPGAETATVRFRLPEKTLAGTALESLTEARIYRDNTLIGSMTEDVAPGVTLSFVDTEAVTRGMHTYSVAAVSAEGEGKAISGQLWRGADYPGRPTNLRIWEDLETTGLLHVTFDHPERGYYGGYVNPDEIRYYIDYLVMGNASGLVELGYGNEHTFQLPFEVKAQDIFAGSVYGGNSTGTIAQSSNWTTQVCYFGPALPLPIHESWSGMSQKSGIWGGQSIDENAGLSETFWDILNGQSGRVTAQDADEGLLGISTKVDNGGKRILSPRFTIEGTVNPALVFYYNYSPDATEFNVEILVDDQPIKLLRSIDLNEGDAGKWIRMEIPLAEYSGSKYLQIGFAARGLTSDEFACIDNVTISDLKANDLSVESFTAPAKLNANEEAALAAIIRNRGSKDVAGKDYTVRFYKNGEVIDEVPGIDLMADDEATFTTTDKTTVADPEQTRYYAEIIFDADEDIDNNISKNVTTRVVVTDYPTVTDLKATENSGIVVLEWSDPDMSQIPGTSVTETFESYEPFIISNIGNWGLYDGDGANTVRMANSMGVLDYPHIGEAMAWQVFDPEQANVVHSAWFARSGSKMLVSFQAASSDTRDIKSDDWLISPELDGSEQVISFYSRTGMKNYSPEIFDFMISDKGDAIADFSAFAENVEVGYAEDWTEFTFRVPAGTRYFAIVHKSADKFAMLVDDITYIPAGSASVQLDLLGFNVYRNGKRLNDEPVGDNFYDDRDAKSDGNYSYCVSAVWDKGESRLSAPATVLVGSDIDGVEAHELTVKGLKGLIRIAGGEGEDAVVYDTAGRLVASAKAEGVTIIPVGQPGIYIVSVGNTAVKVKVD